MRAAEALILGSTILKPLAGDQNNGQGEGCGLGMIAAAHGVTRLSRIENTPLPQFNWLLNGIHSEKLPCGCGDSELLLGPSNKLYRKELLEHWNVGVFIHLFNYHVATKKDWTIEQLAAWLDSVDPTPREVVKEVEKEAVEV